MLEKFLGLLGILGLLLAAVTALWAGSTLLNLLWNLLLLACQHFSIRFAQDKPISWLPPFHYLVACVSLLILLSVFL
ncbi:MAG TPA: hypothetical protein V6D05_03965 [Stenomitos sp.]